MYGPSSMGVVYKVIFVFRKKNKPKGRHVNPTVIACIKGDILFIHLLSLLSSFICCPCYLCVQPQKLRTDIVILCGVSMSSRSAMYYLNLLNVLCMGNSLHCIKVTADFHFCPLDFLCSVCLFR